MGLFQDMMAALKRGKGARKRIGGGGEPAAQAQAQPNTPRPQAGAQSLGTAPQATPAGLPAQSAALTDVDVEAELEERAAEARQPLNWRTSIVDLMKLLDMDPSLANRKELAHELGYAGDTSDSAAMNVWLHKRVLKAFAENGGKVPAGLLD